MTPEKLARKFRRFPLLDCEAVTFQPVDMGHAAVEDLIPQREPFSFIDRIKAIDSEHRGAVGEFTIAPDDPVFRGHFPGDPVLPGVLQIEMVGQLAIAYLVLEQRGGRGTQRTGGFRITKILHALFLREVRPGDTAEIMAKVLEEDEYHLQGIGQVRVEQQVCMVVIADFFRL